MSETLDSLIRLHRWQVDERQRQLVELETLAGKLRQELARLAEERVAEPTSDGGTLLARHIYPGSLRRPHHRWSTLEQSLAETEAQIAQARDVLAEAVQELKRHEVAYAARERLRTNAAARRARRFEPHVISIENFRRRANAR